MDIRSADATLKGYFYQFNKTIEEIMSLTKDSDSIVVEGIEDIDINSLNGVHSVQCKYYSSQNLTYSNIRDAIILMLDHHRNPTSIAVSNYTLYGFFKNEPSGKNIVYTLTELKAILTYKENKVPKEYHTDNAIDDTALNAFLNKFMLKTGKDFDDHRTDCINLLKHQYKCTPFEAENYYYNNAVRIVFDLAIKKKAVDRQIVKKDFIKLIDCGNTLFYSWYKKYRSGQQYTSLIKRGIRDANLFSPAKEKLLFLGQGVDFNASSMPLPAFIESMVSKYFEIGSVKYTARPLTVVLDIDQSAMLTLKKHLISKHIPFNDGHEAIQFSCEGFCNDPIINRHTGGNGKITKSSFVIRILSKSTFDSHYTSFTKPFSVLAISEEDFAYPKFKQNQLIEAKYLTTLSDINSVL